MTVVKKASVRRAPQDRVFNPPASSCFPSQTYGELSPCADHVTVAAPCLRSAESERIKGTLAPSPPPPRVSVSRRFDPRATHSHAAAGSTEGLVFPRATHSHAAAGSTEGLVFPRATHSHAAAGSTEGLAFPRATHSHAAAGSTEGLAFPRATHSHAAAGSTEGLAFSVSPRDPQPRRRRQH